MGQETFWKALVANAGEGKQEVNQGECILLHTRLFIISTVNTWQIKYFSVICKINGYFYSAYS